jgi:hypothetical protein
MIAFASILAPFAEEAGIPVPPDCENYDEKAFPQWHLFCCAQLGNPLPYPSAHQDNAKVIAAIKPEDCMGISWNGLISKGFAIGHSK